MPGRKALCECKCPCAWRPRPTRTSVVSSLKLGRNGCEEYIEEQGLYEVFEDMMRSLIVNKPEDPIKFLIDKIEKPESK